MYQQTRDKVWRRREYTRLVAQAVVGAFGTRRQVQRLCGAEVTIMQWRVFTILWAGNGVQRNTEDNY